MLIYGGITWPDVDMDVSDAVRKRIKSFEEKCKKTVERLVERE